MSFKYLILRRLYTIIFLIQFPFFCFALDITDTILTNRSSDCVSYIDNYTANIDDLQNENSFNMSLTISDNFDGFCKITSNGIPNHNFNGTGNFATPVTSNQRDFLIQRNPQIKISITNLAQNYWDAVMLNGVVLDLLSAGCYNPTAQNSDSSGNTAIGCNINDDWLLDPLGSEYTFGADEHNAHTQPDGTYHYHGDPVALWRNDDLLPINIPSPVIGFAADGFPIYGPYIYDEINQTVRKVISGYSLKDGNRPGPDINNPGGNFDGTYIDDYEFTNSGDLDQCNGMEVNGEYGYYITESYPWVLNCFVGTVHSSFGKNQNNGGGASNNFPRYDRDGDSIRNRYDNCPDTSNISQEDLDNDGLGDLCDDDMDNDGYLNNEDDYPRDETLWAYVYNISFMPLIGLMILTFLFIIFFQFKKI